MSNGPSSQALVSLHTHKRHVVTPSQVNVCCLPAERYMTLRAFLCEGRMPSWESVLIQDPPFAPWVSSTQVCLPLPVALEVPGTQKPYKTSYHSPSLQVIYHQASSLRTCQYLRPFKGTVLFCVCACTVDASLHVSKQTPSPVGIRIPKNSNDCDMFHPGPAVPQLALGSSVHHSSPILWDQVQLHIVAPGQ